MPSAEIQSCRRLNDQSLDSLLGAGPPGGVPLPGTLALLILGIAGVAASQTRSARLRR